ncbi:unnamed protein product [Cunninghamella echinulata]
MKDNRKFCLIALDLTNLGDLTASDKAKRQCIIKSNTLNNGDSLNKLGYVTGTSLADGSILMYGGARLYGPKIDLVNHNPFIHYDPNSNIWNDITLPNNTYTILIFIILVPLNNSHSKIELWLIIVPSSRPVNDVDHTATLVKDLINIVISDYISIGNGHTMTGFPNFTTYNIINGEFGSFKTRRTDINSRGYHKTILTNDGKYLITYGSIMSMDNVILYACEEIYYVYDIATNYLVEVTVPSHPGLNSSRNIIHSSTRFTTFYKNNCLLLVFRYHTLDIPSDSPYKPTWIPLLTTNSVSIPQFNVPDLKTISTTVIFARVTLLNNNNDKNN